MRTFPQTMSSTPVKDIHSASIFELSDEGLQERLRPAYEAMKQKAFANGSFITYSDPSVCPTSSHMVHEYSDRKELMWMDDAYKEHFVKYL